MFWLKPDAVLVDGVLRTDLAVLVSRGDGEGQIVSLGTPNPRDGATVTELPRRVLLPGFVNAHSEAWRRALRGWAQHAAGEGDGASLRDAGDSLAGRLTPEALEAVCTLAFAEMLRAGFTSAGEVLALETQADGTPYAEVDELALRVVAAAKRVGLRLVLLRRVGGRPGPRAGRASGAEAAREAVERLRARGLDVGVALGAVDQLADDLLARVALLPAHIHAPVAEDAGAVARCVAATGRTPVARLAEAGVLGPRFTAVHVLHASAADRVALGESGATVCACPSTELDRGAGFFPPSNGLFPVAIGSGDNAVIDPFAELRTLEWTARAVAGRRDVSGREGGDTLAVDLLRHGIEHGARALGLHAGRLAAGFPADLVAIDTARLEFGAARLLPALVFNGSAAAVRDVWVGGRHVVRDGRVPGGEAVVAEAERAMRRLAM